MDASTNTKLVRSGASLLAVALVTGAFMASPALGGGVDPTQSQAPCPQQSQEPLPPGVKPTPQPTKNPCPDPSPSQSQVPVPPDPQPTVIPKPTPTPTSVPVPKPTPTPTFVPKPSDSPSPSQSPSQEPQQPGPQPPAPTPSTGPAGEDDRLGGGDRIDTAVNVSQDLFPNGAPGVIIARSDDPADSVSAVPFAKLKQVPILLTPPDRLHEATAKEIKRLMPKGGTAYIMGREVAIHPKVEDEIKAIVGETDRIAGANRAGTAVDTAMELEAMGKFKHIVITDGSDWMPDLIAGPAAAVVEGGTLLTWGERQAPETVAYLKSHGAKPMTAIGAKAAKAGHTRNVIDESEPTKLSMAVINRFFTDPTNVGFATTADFADALTGGAHMAGITGPLVLVGDTTPPEVLAWVKDTKSLKRLVIYGGTARISEAQEKALREAMKH